MAQLIICVLLVVYLTLPLSGWKFVFKTAIYSIVGFLRVAKWTIIVVCTFGALISRPVYDVFGCTPLMLINPDAKQFYTDQAAAEEKREAAAKKMAKDKEYYDNLILDMNARATERYNREVRGE